MQANWITIIGMAAACLTTFSYIPQMIKVIKTKRTKDISVIMYFAIMTGIFLWLVYGICLKDWPIILANAISLVFTGTIFILKLKYK
ncbi:MAG: SemiSWEET transporter [Bacteroidota bacterium]|nr:SemiSWEET transporter [Bacteroidota bacterium]